MKRTLRRIALASLLVAPFAVPMSAEAQQPYDYDNYYWGDYHNYNVYDEYRWDYDWPEGWEYTTPYAKYDYEDDWWDNEWELEDEDWWW